jgi:hypothetical protein
VLIAACIKNSAALRLPVPVIHEAAKADSSEHGGAQKDQLWQDQLGSERRGTMSLKSIQDGFKESEAFLQFLQSKTKRLPDNLGSLQLRPLRVGTLLSLEAWAKNASPEKLLPWKSHSEAT